MTATNLLEDPNIAGIVINSRDATSRVTAEEWVRANEERFRLLVRHAHDAIITFDLSGTCTYASPAATRALGYEPEDMVGAQLADQVHPDDYERLAAEITTCLEVPNSTTLVEYRSLHADGFWRVVETNFTNLLEEPAVGAIVANLHDVTELRAAQLLLEHQATHDSLTDLPNRKMLHALGAEAGRRAGAQRGSVAFLFLDLDGFKPVNDEVGHDVGDLVLATVAHRLRRDVRVGDVVGRIGGDEFGVVCEGIGADEAVELARRIRRGIHTPIALEHDAVTVDCSIGVAVATGATSLDRLMAEADAALRRAKLRGKGRVELSRVPS
jgi:diguanylate cyclase (GGDEF)-like protein/PAS domain S-box-containing protein